jgi:hypothetical protein
MLPWINLGASATQAAGERIAEIFEKLLLHEPGLTGELGRCDTTDLVKPWLTITAP